MNDMRSLGWGGDHRRLPTRTMREVPRCRHGLPQERRAEACQESAPALARRRETPVSRSATGPSRGAALVVALLLGVAGWLAVGGCRGPKQLSVQKLSIATGSRGGTYYPVGEALAKFFGERFPNLQIEVMETDGSIQNLNLLAEGKADLALTQNDIAHYAAFGERMFEGGRNQRVAGIANLFPEVVQIVTRAEDRIKDLGALAGKRVAFGSKDSGTYANAQQILGLAEVWDKIKPVELNPAEGPRALEHKQIDCFLFTAGIPTTSVKVLAQQMAVGFVPLPIDFVQKLVNQHPFYFPSEIPATTYNGQNEAVPAVEINALLVVRNDLPAADIEALAGMLFSNLKDVRALHPRLAQASLQSMQRQMTIDLAPGVKKAAAAAQAQP